MPWWKRSSGPEDYMRRSRSRLERVQVLVDRLGVVATRAGAPPEDSLREIEQELLELAQAQKQEHAPDEATVIHRDNYATLMQLQWEKARDLRLHGGAKLEAIQEYEEQFLARTMEAATGQLVGTDKMRRALGIPDDEEPWVTRLSMRIDGAFDCYVQFDRLFWSGNASNEFLQSLEQKVVRLAEAQLNDPPPDHGENASQLQAATVRVLDLHRRVFESARLRDADGVSQYFEQLKAAMGQVDELRG